MKYNGFIFDFDGLLFDTEEVYYNNAQKVADAFHFPFDKAYYRRFIGLSDEELWDNYHRDFDPLSGAEKTNQFIRESYALTRAQFAKGEVPLKAGALELLKRLNARQLPCVIASSNNREAIDFLLQSKKLENFFTAIVSAEDVPLAKPDPAIVNEAIKRLAVPKDEVLMLEDSYNGVRAGAAAEIAVIMVPDLLPPTPEMKEKTLAIIPSLNDVGKFLFS